MSFPRMLPPPNVCLMRKNGAISTRFTSGCDVRMVRMFGWMYKEPRCTTPLADSTGSWAHSVFQTEAPGWVLKMQYRPPTYPAPSNKDTDTALIDYPNPAPAWPRGQRCSLDDRRVRHRDCSGLR